MADDVRVCFEGDLVLIRVAGVPNTSTLEDAGISCDGRDPKLGAGIGAAL